MSVERLITCSCGHFVDEHDLAGCSGGIGTVTSHRSGRMTCSCRHTRRSVLDALLDFERDSIHQEWRTPSSR